MMSERGSEHEARLPRPPGAIRRVMAEHPLLVDVGIVVCYVLGSALMLLIDLFGAAADLEELRFGLPEHLAWPWWPITLLCMLTVGAALLYRRRYPLTGLVVAMLPSFLDIGAMGVATSVALLFMIYAVPVYRSTAAGWVGYGIAVFGSTALNLIDFLLSSVASGASLPSGLFIAHTGLTRLPDMIGLSVMSAVWYLAILLLGINIGNRRRYLEAIIDRANQLARERDQRARLAVAEERSRIAREMHDIVAHSVSVMIALSEGAARSAAAAPEAASDAMQRSAETGRTALAEMRRLLGALQTPGDEPAELAPQPSLGELPELVQGFRDAGLDVSLAMAGEPSGDLGQELALYRIAQEGLTNVLRYAGVGARAEVRVEALEGQTVIEVRDHGPQPGSFRQMSGLGSGNGLAGLAERVRMLGGSIEVGPVPAPQSIGWRLCATLPIDAAAQPRGIHPAELRGADE